MKKRHGLESVAFHIVHHHKKFAIPITRRKRVRFRVHGTLKPDDERADDRLFVRLLAAEKASWQVAADKQGLKLSEWIRKHLNKVAEQQAAAR